MYPLMTVLAAMFSIVFVLFVPGVCISFAFYPRKEDLDMLERVVLSFGFGIAVVPLSVFYANKLLGVPVNVFTSILLVVLVSCIALAVWYKRVKRVRGRDRDQGLGTAIKTFGKKYSKGRK